MPFGLLRPLPVIPDSFVQFLSIRVATAVVAVAMAVRPVRPDNRFMMTIACRIVLLATIAIRACLASASLPFNLVARTALNRFHCLIAHQDICAICAIQIAVSRTMIVCVTRRLARMAWFIRERRAVANLIVRKGPTVMSRACAKAITLANARKVIHAMQKQAVACRPACGHPAINGSVWQPARWAHTATFSTQHAACLHHRAVLTDLKTETGAACRSATRV